ncbi:MAG: hypothetical protein ACR2GK_09110 [Gemmatimonadaceae bacterium]
MAGGFFSLLFAIPVVLYFARRRWKKRGAKPARELSGEVAQRLERLEHGMARSPSRSSECPRASAS